MLNGKFVVESPDPPITNKENAVDIIISKERYRRSLCSIRTELKAKKEGNFGKKYQLIS